jgi:integrase
MPKLEMTDAAVRRTTAKPGQRIDYFDDHKRDRQRGLVLRVSGSLNKGDGGLKVTRTWVALCRVRGSTKLRRFTIGDYPGVGLGEARERAAKIVGEARRDGVDPLKERKEAARQAEIAGRDTVEAVVAAYLADLEKRPKKKGGGLRSPRYVQESRRNLTNHVLSRWGGLNVREIRRRDIEALLEAVMEQGSKVRGEGGEKRELKGGPIIANRVQQAIHAFLAFAVRREILDANPASGFERLADETKRERTLTADEIAMLWPALDKLGYPYGAAFKLELITGQRRNEVGHMRWADLDLTEKTWTIPRADTKSGREQIVPLSPLACEVIRSLPKIGKEFLFLGDNGKPICGFSSARAKLAEIISEGGATIAPWTLHDMRRTCATGLGRLGVSEFIISKVLNHAPKGVTGQVYNRYEYVSEKRHALETWARHLENLIDPPSGSVMPMRPAEAAA